MNREFIEKLIDIRELCRDAECEDCPYTINKYNDCCFDGVPCQWDDLEKFLKKESTPIEYIEEDEMLLIDKKQFEKFNNSIRKEK